MFEHFIQLFILLFIIVDPLGNLAIFIGLTSDIDKAKRKKIIFKATLAASLILILFALFGNHILRALNLNPASFAIAGGLLLLIIALKMVFEPLDKILKEDKNIDIVPLAIPLLAGPGAIAAVIVYSVSNAGLEKIMAIAAIASVMFLVAITFSSSEYLLKILKQEGTKTLTKIMGVILVAISIEMIFNGIKILIL